ncbi:hypothetical protein [Methylorubrum extorquens]
MKTSPRITDAWALHFEPGARTSGVTLFESGAARQPGPPLCAAETS